MKYLKRRLVWASALALALTLVAPVATLGQTNGVILVVTRYEQDLSWYNEDGDICDGMKITGGGQCSQGDVAMAELLSDYGYPTRVIIDMELNAGGPYSRPNPYTGFEPNPVAYLQGGSSLPFQEVNTNYRACLIIQSGSANSSRAPLLATNGVPYMCGEHVILSDRLDRFGSIFMYTRNPGGTDDDAGTTLSTNQWMRVTAAGKAHPILQGIPLDANDCVKIYRDPYPEEVIGHRPVGCNPLWQWDIPYAQVANAAPGTAVLGLMGSDSAKSIFAVIDVGGQLANGQSATVRMVHYYVSEGGQDSYRRVFNSLSDMGRLIFVRAAKWAMGETLAPYQPVGVIKVSKLGGSQIRLAWTGSATKNYKVLGSADLLSPPTSWQIVADDITGVEGADATTTTLDISGALQYAFLRVKPVP